MDLASIKGKSYADNNNITENHSFSLNPKTRVLWMSLLLISMVSATTTGMSSLSNQEAVAQDEGFGGSFGDEGLGGSTTQFDKDCTNFVEVNCGAGTGGGQTNGGGGEVFTEDQNTGGVSFLDEDGDNVNDAYDPCIDPNDFLNACAVTDRDHDGRPNESDVCPDDELDLCPANGANPEVEAICRDSAENAYINAMRDCGATPSTSSTTLPNSMTLGLEGGSKNFGVSGSYSVPLGKETTYSLQPGSVQATCEKLNRNTQAEEYNKCITNWPNYDPQKLPTPDQLKEVCSVVAWGSVYKRTDYNLCENRAGEKYWKDKFGVKFCDYMIGSEEDVLSPGLYYPFTDRIMPTTPCDPGAARGGG